MSAARDLFGLFPELPAAGDQHQDSDADRRILARLGPGPIERFARTGRINWSATLASRPDRPCEVCQTPTPVRFIRHGNLAKTCGSASCRASLTDPAARGAKGNATRKAQREALNGGAGPMCKVCRVLPATRNRNNGAWDYCRKPGSGKRTTACTRRAQSAYRSGFTMDHAGYVAALAARRAAERAAREQREAKREAKREAIEKREAEALARRHQRAVERAVKRADAERQRRDRKETVPCPICSTPFERRRTDLHPKATCGAPDCRRVWNRSVKNVARTQRRQTERQMLGTPAAERIAIATLGERAGWLCQAVKPNGSVCCRPCVTTGNPLAKNYATLGHIFPVSDKQGRGVTSLANCRLECFDCNRRDGARSRGNLFLPF